MHAILDKETGMIVECEWYEWAPWFEKDQNRLIELTRFATGHRVSTIFEGLSRGIPGEDPDWFETIVFGPRYILESSLIAGKKLPVSDELWSKRTSTLEKAREAHEQGSAWLRERLSQSGPYQLCLPQRQ